MSWLDLTRRAVVAACVAVASAATLSACASAPREVQSPEAILLAFARALSDGKPEAAYALMSSEYRRRVSFAAWQKNLDENSQEAIEIGSAVSHRQGRAEVQALIHAADGQEVRLTREGKRWLIASDLMEFYDQSTPRAALHAFVHAMQRKRYDVVLRLMPDADKEGVTTASMDKAWGHESGDDVQRMLSQLRSHQDDPIEVVGNRATMPYAERSRVQFLREGGRWKIEDPE
jgi:hypothetical protein